MSKGKETMLVKNPFQKFIGKFPLFNIGLVIGLGVTLANPAMLLASPLKESGLVQGKLIAQSLNTNSLLSDGIYLYGQSASPEQIGQEYLVFKVTQGKVIGAFYMPRSEFNCFSGTITLASMNLSITDPYDNTVSSYSIALQELSPIAGNSQIHREIGLEGYQQIKKISENDQRILNVCLDQ